MNEFGEKNLEKKTQNKHILKSKQKQILDAYEKSNEKSSPDQQTNLTISVYDNDKDTGLIIRNENDDENDNENSNDTNNNNVDINSDIVKNGI